LKDEDWRGMFAPEGRLLLQGETIRRTNYSRTLASIASDGPDTFYSVCIAVSIPNARVEGGSQGFIADAIVRRVQGSGGILTHADLEGYSVKVERALEGTYHDKKVYTTHAPTSGPVLLHMLNLMERYNLAEEGRTELNFHRLVEAQKCERKFSRPSLTYPESWRSWLRSKVRLIKECLVGRLTRIPGRK